MSEHVWKWGDWGRTKSGTIVRFVSVWDGGEIFRGEHGAVNCLRDVAYLPDCTGWDWKPIEPPEGYRLLEDYEVIARGDKCFACRSLGWQDMLENSSLIGRQYQPCETTKFARRIEPQYRPFANAAEFEPFRSRWWKYKQTKDDQRILIRPPACYSDCAHDGRTWQARFNECVFEHGEPFGVEDK